MALLGYRHPRLVAALAGQAEELFFQSNSVPLAVRARAAERLVRFGPAGLTRAFLVNSGAEANENALRLAFRAHRAPPGRGPGGSLPRPHGGGGGGQPQVGGAGTASRATPFAVTFVPRGDLEALEAALATDVAALIVEPIQGLAGAVDLGARLPRGGARAHPRGRRPARSSTRCSAAWGAPATRSPRRPTASRRTC